MARRAYVELAGASHFFPKSPNATVSRAMVSWFKRFLNNDARFTQFTCGFGGVAVSQVPHQRLLTVPVKGRVPC